MVQGPWEGAEGEVTASCMMAAKSKYNPNPRAEQVWVQFDNPRIGTQHDIYDYQLEKISTLHLGDIVEEIATTRPGKIDTGPTLSTAGPIAPNWRVIFTDGKKPLYKYFDNEEELRVKWCPHKERGNMH
jgi:hypothetical protein